jgi:hypothetical protein
MKEVEPGAGSREPGTRKQAADGKNNQPGNKSKKPEALNPFQAKLMELKKNFKD